MNKMQIAHDMALAMAANGNVPNEDIVAIVWQYADAMQAEADEREDKTRPKALLTSDKDGKCLHFNHEFGHKKCMDCGASLEEWQPDWSQAPEWAKYWHYDSYRSAYWVDAKPDTRSDTAWSFDFMNKRVVEAPSFGYQGNWKDSLRKRPEPKWKVDWSQAPSGALSYHIELDELDGSIQPFWTDSLETHFDGEMFVGYKCAWNAPSFDYQGNWKNSLRKRP